MRRKVSSKFKRSDLHLEVLWSDALRSLPPESEDLFRSDPRKLAFAKALVEYFTHLLPSADGSQRSLALECLLLAASSSPSGLDDFIAAALLRTPEALTWHVYTYRGSVNYVWDPISGPLSSFILASPSLPQISPAPRLEGASADPDSFRFLLREKLLLRARSSDLIAHCA